VGNNQEGDGAAPVNRANVETFLREIVTAAPDVVVQIAHLWGGQGYSQTALEAYAEAVASRAPGTQNLYFDIAEAPLIASQYPPTMQRQILERVAAAIRRIGTDRILYGSDGALEGHLPPAEAWAQFRMSVPLTDEEFARIARNVAPYAR
jgi:predicted TIM-barrel fold metal-dependent hydrolase